MPFGFDEFFLSACAVLLGFIPIFGPPVQDRRPTWVGIACGALLLIVLVGNGFTASQHRAEKLSLEGEKATEQRERKAAQVEKIKLEGEKRDLNAKIDQLTRRAERAEEDSMSLQNSSVVIVSKLETSEKKEAEQKVALNELMQRMISTQESNAQLTQDTQGLRLEIVALNDRIKKFEKLVREATDLSALKKAIFGGAGDEPIVPLPTIVQLDFAPGTKFQYSVPGGVARPAEPQSVYIQIAAGTYYRLTCGSECYWADAALAQESDSVAMMRKPGIAAARIKNPGLAVEIVQGNQALGYRNTPGTLKFDGVPASNPRFIYPQKEVPRVGVTP